MLVREQHNFIQAENVRLSLLYSHLIYLLRLHLLTHRCDAVGILTAQYPELYSRGRGQYNIYKIICFIHMYIDGAHPNNNRGPLPTRVSFVMSFNS